MKRIVLIVLTLAACRSVPIGAAPGASSPTMAVERMLAGAKAQDLQAVSAVWGNEQGLNRDRMPRAELESRAFIISCVLKSDSAKLSEPTPAGSGRFMVQGDLTQGKNSGSTRFETVKSKDGQWVVSNVDLVALQNKGFCGK